MSNNLERQMNRRRAAKHLKVTLTTSERLVLASVANRQANPSDRGTNLVGARKLALLYKAIRQEEAVDMARQAEEDQEVALARFRRDHQEYRAAMEAARKGVAIDPMPEAPKRPALNMSDYLPDDSPQEYRIRLSVVQWLRGAFKEQKEGMTGDPSHIVSAAKAIGCDLPDLGDEFDGADDLLDDDDYEDDDEADEAEPAPLAPVPDAGGDATE